MTVSCLTCQSQNIEEVVKDGRRYFFCDDCDQLYDRALNSLHPTGNRDEIQHITVGGLIKNGESLLLIKRRAYPFGFAFPAGHRERSETPQQTLEREIGEETGLQVVNSTLLFEGVIPSSKCRYGSDHHYWYFFACDCVNNTPLLNPESEKIGWYTPREIAGLDLIPSSRFLFERIGVEYG